MVHTMGDFFNKETTAMDNQKDSKPPAGYSKAPKGWTTYSIDDELPDPPKEIWIDNDMKNSQK